MQRQSNKLPIARLPTLRGSTSPSNTHSRVAQACEQCRKRKIRCNGEKPTCKNCADADGECVYITGRRDHTKQALQKQKEKFSEALDLLRKLSLHADSKDQRKIRELSDFAVHDEISVGDSALHSSSTFEGAVVGDRDVKKNHGESHITAEVGSEESTDMVEENLDENDVTRATGFNGKNSDLHWLLCAEKQLELGHENRGAREKKPFGPPGKTAEAIRKRVEARGVRKSHWKGLAVSSKSYHLDMDPVGLKRHFIDAEALPDFEVAQALVKSYFDFVHEDFLILDKSLFIHDFERLYQEAGMWQQTRRTSNKLKAIINLVFAISTRRAFLVGEPLGHDEVHVIYSMRAQTLGLTAESWTEHPDLQQTQVFGLLGFYFMTIAQQNRAWTMIGCAIRYAFSLGFHVRAEDTSLSPSEKELRVRIWWALYLVERQVGEILGRPSSIEEDSFSKTKPLPYDPKILAGVEGEKILAAWYPNHLGAAERDFPDVDRKDDDPLVWPRASAGVFMRLRIDLAILTHLALTRLYAAGTMMKSWEHFQNDIRGILRKLTDWVTKLPPEYDFLSGDRSVNHNDGHARHRYILASLYFSCRMIATRPAICRLDVKILNQSSVSRAFDREILRICVESAIEQVNLLPENPNAFLIFRFGAWWCQIHLLVQATSVLLLELSQRSLGMQNSIARIWASLIKVLQCIYTLGKIEKSSQKAYDLVLELVQKAAANYDWDISELQPSFGTQLQDAVSATPNFSTTDSDWMGFGQYSATIADGWPMAGTSDGPDINAYAGQPRDAMDFEPFALNEQFPLSQQLGATGGADVYVDYSPLDPANEIDHGEDDSR